MMTQTCVTFSFLNCYEPDINTDPVDEEDDEVGEEASPHKSEAGEGRRSYLDLAVEEVIVPKSLTFQEASSCLHMLGKDESGMRYAYLMITCTDRKLTEICVITQFTHVLFVDLSGNKLDNESIQCLENVPYLIYLKLTANRIDKLHLNTMFYLQVLDLSRNKIVETAGLKQPMLECLDLNYNFIDHVDLDNTEFTDSLLPNLKQLELRGNLLATLTGVFPKSITILYLAENQIRTVDIDVLRSMPHLKRLHLRDNLIKKLNGFSSDLRNLTYINIRKNQIKRIKELNKLSVLPRLDTLVVSGNPINPEVEATGEGGKEEEEEEVGEEEMEEKLDPFRVDVLVLLPYLKRINKLPVRAAERMAADNIRKQKLEDILLDVSSPEETDEDVGAESPEEDFE